MILDYISITAGSNTWKIPTNLTLDETMTKNMYIRDVTGLIEMGEATSDSTPYSYSHGSVLPPVPYYRGKNIMISIIFTGGDTKSFQNYNLMTQALATGGAQITSNLGSTYTVNLVRVDLGDNPRHFIVADFQFIAKEAF